MAELGDADLSGDKCTEGTRGTELELRSEQSRDRARPRREGGGGHSTRTGTATAIDCHASVVPFEVIVHFAFERYVGVKVKSDAASETGEIYGIPPTGLYTKQIAVGDEFSVVLIPAAFVWAVSGLGRCLRWILALRVD